MITLGTVIYSQVWKVCRCEGRPCYRRTWPGLSPLEPWHLQLKQHCEKNIRPGVAENASHTWTRVPSHWHLCIASLHVSPDGVVVLVLDSDYQNKERELWGAGCDLVWQAVWEMWMISSLSLSLSLPLIWSIGRRDKTVRQRKAR